jgi:hypothetical protein
MSHCRNRLQSSCAANSAVICTAVRGAGEHYGGSRVRGSNPFYSNANRAHFLGSCHIDKCHHYTECDCVSRESLWVDVCLSFVQGEGCFSLSARGGLHVIAGHLCAAVLVRRVCGTVALQIAVPLPRFL